jgi:hypothetical protein
MGNKIEGEGNGEGGYLEGEYDKIIERVQSEVINSPVRRNTNNSKVHPHGYV